MSSYRRRVGKWLKIGIRRIYHKAAYLCNRRAQKLTHSPEILKPCHSPEVGTHILEEKVFEMIKDKLVDVSKLKTHMEFFRNNYRADQKRVEWRFMRLEKKLKRIQKEKEKLIEKYTDNKISQEEFVNENVRFDQDLLRTKLKKEKLLKIIPSLHKKDDVEISLRKFCDNAKARLEKCVDFESKRKFLLDHIENVIYHKYKVVLVGHVTIFSQDNNTGSKISFKLEDEISKTKIRSRKKLRFLVDSRLKEWGAGGRDVEVHNSRMKELQSPHIKATLITQQIIDEKARTIVGYTVNGRKENHRLRDRAQNIFSTSTTPTITKTAQ